MADSLKIVDTATPVLSFPAILRNPGIKNRYAHLENGLDLPRKQISTSASAVVKKRLREQNEGKRWIRRKDNAKFVGNPHVVGPTRKDFTLPTPQTRPTFPEPLPPYLPRTSKVPSLTQPAVTDPNSANAGRFSLSLKGMRRDLRRAGGLAQALVREIEDIIVDWLQAGGIVLAPETLDKQPLDPDASGVEIGNTGSIFEVSRSPLQLVWRVHNDSFTRYVVHCCARYHEIVSYSKGPEDKRLTYLLRPNVTRPDHIALASLETPPVTDIDYSSQQSDLDIDSDFVSEHDLDLSGIDSETEGDPRLPRSQGGLEAIREVSTPPSPNMKDMSASWYAVEDADADADDSGSEIGLESAVASITLGSVSSPLRDGTVYESEEVDPDQTLIEAAAPVLPETTSPRPSTRTMDHTPSNANRSTSSPSRSPVRIRQTRKRFGKRHVGVAPSDRASFYDYLFA